MTVAKFPAQERKTCSRCNQAKPASAFYRKTAGRLRSRRMGCTALDVASSATVFGRYLSRCYGLKVSEFEAILERRA
jgi:hypothetical protein